MPGYYLQISLVCSTFHSQATYKSIKIGSIYRLSSPQHVPLQCSLYGRNTIAVFSAAAPQGLCHGFSWY